MPTETSGLTPSRLENAREAVGALVELAVCQLIFAADRCDGQRRAFHLGLERVARCRRAHRAGGVGAPGLQNMLALFVAEYMYLGEAPLRARRHLFQHHLQLLKHARHCVGGEEICSVAIESVRPSGVSTRSSVRSNWSCRC